MLSQVDVILSEFVVISAFLALISSKLLLQCQPCGLPVTSIDITTRQGMNLVLFLAKTMASRFHVYGYLDTSSSTWLGVHAVLRAALCSD